MVSFKIAVAETDDKTILTKPRDWSENLTTDHLDRMFKDGDIRDIAKKRWRSQFTGLHWAHIKNYQAWGNGYSFSFLGHKILPKTITTATGSKVDFDIEAHICFVMIQMVDDFLVVYFSGSGGYLDTARVRLAQFLNPTRKQGWLKVLKLQPEELAEIRKNDVASPEDIRTLGFRRGDGFNDVTVSGLQVHRSFVEKGLVHKDLNGFRYGSDWLTKHMKAKDLVIVNLSGKSGSISASCAHEPLDKYVHQIIIPAVKKHRGKIALA